MDHRGKVLTGDLLFPIKWMLNSYQIAVDTSTLSKELSLEPLREALRAECSLGHLVRQELVSMIPALFLSVKSSDRVRMIAS